MGLLFEAELFLGTHRVPLISAQTGKFVGATFVGEDLVIGFDANGKVDVVLQQHIDHRAMPKLSICQDLSNAQLTKQSNELI